MDTGTRLSFFDLPRKTRDNIYGRILVVNHPIDLFRDTGGPVEAFAPEQPNHWTAALYVNRQMSRESGAILYGMNVFVVDEIRQQGVILEAFLKTIGPVNSASLSRLTLNLPAVIPMSEGFRLRDDSAHALRLIRIHCTGLQTLEFLSSGLKSFVFDPTIQDNVGTADEALSTVDLQIKAIGPLDRVLVRAKGQDSSSPLLRIMQDLGWIIIAADKRES